MVIDPMVL
jgi:hypothetical protein